MCQKFSYGADEKGETDKNPIIESFCWPTLSGMNSGNVALQMQQQMHARHVALTLNPPEGARPHANAAHAHMNYVKMMLRTRAREGGREGGRQQSKIAPKRLAIPSPEWVVSLDKSKNCRGDRKIVPNVNVGRIWSDYVSRSYVHLTRYRSTIAAWHLASIGAPLEL